MANPYHPSHVFKASNEPGTCLWCGRKLSIWGYGPERGYAGDEKFCSLSCGYRFGAACAEHGTRFEKKTSTPSNGATEQGSS